MNTFTNETLLNIKPSPNDGIKSLDNQTIVNAPNIENFDKKYETTTETKKLPVAAINVTDIITENSTSAAVNDRSTKTTMPFKTSEIISTVTKKMVSSEPSSISVILTESSTQNSLKISSTESSLPKSSLITSTESSMPKSSLISSTESSTPKSSLISSTESSMPKSSLISSTESSTPKSSLISSTESSTSKSSEISSTESSTPKSSLISSTESSTSKSLEISITEKMSSVRSASKQTTVKQETQSSSTSTKELSSFTSKMTSKFITTVGSKFSTKVSSTIDSRKLVSSTFKSLPMSKEAMIEEKTTAKQSSTTSRFVTKQKIRNKSMITSPSSYQTKITPIFIPKSIVTQQHMHPFNDITGPKNTTSSPRDSSLGATALVSVVILPFITLFLIAIIIVLMKKCKKKTAKRKRQKKEDVELEAKDSSQREPLTKSNNCA